jgi:Ser/Thr protein kinase RdoA (MazF antagonist)
MPDPRQAAAAFCLDGTSCPISPLGYGNINDTFLVASAAGRFVLQRINNQVFPEPERVIDNFAKVTRHLCGRMGRADTRFRTAQPVRALSGALFYRDDRGEYWRSQTYLAGTSCKTLAGSDQAFQIGRALAFFHAVVADLEVQCLQDPLPDFHNLYRYLQEFDQLQVKIHGEMNADYRFCLETIDQDRQRAIILEDAKNAGILTIQTIHGDPKIDNFLFDDQGLADGILDLDTVGAGIIHYDLGDCLRSCCNRAGESGGDKIEVSFDLEICRALLAGYFSEPHQLLAPGQRAYVFDAVLGITFELGLRFFTDYLRGNTYFKVRQNGDNLVRAARQFRLTKDIIVKEKEIRLLGHSSNPHHPR